MGPHSQIGEQAMGRRWKILIVFFIGGLFACATSNPDASSGDDGTPPQGVECEAEESADCVCSDGNTGSQICNSDGTGFEECICLQTPPDATSDTSSSEDATDSGNGRLPFPGSDNGGGPPQGGGPQLCDTQADCDADGMCPSDAALGCECVQGQGGIQRCIPRCESDEDCPTPGNPNITLSCNDNGLCRPDLGPGGGNTDPPDEDDGCKDDDDCAAEGECNPNAPLGCACITIANGDTGCRPKCETKDDCPTPANNPDFQFLCSDDGICEPDNGGEPEPEPEPEPTGPVTCESAADCEEVCPPVAPMGCGCAELPNGNKVCRIKCETTDDCPIPPNNPNANPQCSDNGYCMGGNQGGNNQPPQ